jgi:Uma2 family endonuclease
MNIHDALTALLPATPDEFLRWNENREGKREFVNGRVVEMMINVSFAHYRLASKLQRQLADRIDDARFLVGGSDFAVRTHAGLRFPDVMVVNAGLDPAALATSEPLLVAEILSPSTMAADFGPKRDEYTALASLMHYLVLSQDEMRVWVWSRNEEGRFGEPDIHDAATVNLPGLGITLDLPSLYAGIAPQPSGG